MYNTYIHIHTYIHTHIHVYVFIYTNMHANALTYVHIFVHTGLVCKSPPFPKGAVTVEVALNGQQYSPHTTQVLYFEPPAGTKLYCKHDIFRRFFVPCTSQVLYFEPPAGTTLYYKHDFFRRFWPFKIENVIQSSMGWLRKVGSINL